MSPAASFSPPGVISIESSRRITNGGNILLRADGLRLLFCFSMYLSINCVFFFVIVWVNSITADSPLQTSPTLACREDKCRRSCLLLPFPFWRPIRGCSSVSSVAYAKSFCMCPYGERWGCRALSFHSDGMWCSTRRELALAALEREESMNRHRAQTQSLSCKNLNSFDTPLDWPFAGVSCNNPRKVFFPFFFFLSYGGLV